jgi:hypothetical protein
LWFDWGFEGWGERLEGERVGRERAEGVITHHIAPTPSPPPSNRSNIDEVVMVLKKEIVKTQSSSSDMGERGPEYRQMLVGAIHTCAVKFPDVSGGRFAVAGGEGGRMGGGSWSRGGEDVGSVWEFGGVRGLIV